MRYTIRGRRATIARRDVRTYGLTRNGAWRIDCLAARLERARPVYRERVRFGAWEARPSSVVWKPLDLTPFSWAEHAKRFAEAWEKVEWIRAETGPALAALATESPDPVPAEGPADSGGSQTYKRGEE